MKLVCAKSITVIHITGMYINKKKCGSTLHRNYHTRVLSLFILSSLTEIALEVCHISGLIVVSVLGCSYLPLLGELSGGLVIEEKEGF